MASSPSVYSPVPQAETLDDHFSPYGYRPTFFVCVIYICLFGVTTLMHSVQALWTRRWFLFPTVVLAGSIEILGWSGRLWSSQNLLLSTPYLMQISTLIIGPTPLLAANFVIFGNIVKMLGTEYSRLPPKLYGWIFLTCDIVSLVIQGAGGGLASSAKTRDGMKLGTNLMITGIALQVVMMTTFSILVTEFVLRFLRERPVREPAGLGAELELLNSSESTINVYPFPRVLFDKRRKILLSALLFTTFLLFVRAIYRLVELSGGWDSEIMTTEWFFNVFDAALVTVAFYTWNIAHPGRLLSVPMNEKGHK
ncbi:putative rta1-like protein [Moniliophthora roreri MCA 2997]|uniref:Rta1-like protein n=1 Tax=Moniliophthora roreri (strain MCA 2997) TaxID=1381753 RepID=V2WB09_MONRO|nr:putative rta1-like protein [Moniliophthora roreri MCA 2997]